jgi:hypothetical protein
VRRVDPNRVTELPDVRPNVAEPERRLTLLDVQRVDDEAATRAVGIGDPHPRRDDVRVAPRPRVGEMAAAGSPIRPARKAEAHGNRAVPARAAEGIRRVPGHRENERRVTQTGGVDHDVIAEPRAGSLQQAYRPAPEEPLVVPLPVLVLLDVHPRVLGLEPADDDAAVEQIARVVDDRRPAGAEEQGVVGVPDRDRVDRETRDQVPGELSEVQLAATHAGRDLVLDHLPQGVAPVRRARDPDDHREAGEGDGHEHERTDERDEAATFHWEELSAISYQLSAISYQKHG